MLRRSPLSAALLVLGSLPFCTAPAATIEGLAERPWTGRNGLTMNARLACYPSDAHGSPRTGNLLLVPADPDRAPVSISRDDVGDQDRAYINEITWPRDQARRSMRDVTLTDKDGRPVAGEFVDYNDRDRALTHYIASTRQWIWTDLRSLSPDSLATVTTALRIPPPLETRLETLKPLAARETPVRFAVKSVPLLKQDGNFCVPASATMIATWHDVRINQFQLAHFTSDQSQKHQGTYTDEMANAMESLGFMSESRHWRPPETDEDQRLFEADILDFIRRSLIEDGPLYVTFKPGVYGSRGHGCVIVDYNDANRGSLGLHNPWGRRERVSYRDFSQNASEVIRFHKLPPTESAPAEVEKKIATALTRMPADLTDAMRLLRRAGLDPALRLHGRHDRRDDPMEMRRWALAQGQRIVDSTLKHHAALLLPVCRDQRIVGWYLLRKDGDNPAPLSRPLGVRGWADADRVALSAILKTWASPANTLYQPAWDLPLIEVN